MGIPTCRPCLDVSRRLSAKGRLMCRLDASRLEETCQKMSVTMEAEVSEDTCDMSTSSWPRRHL